MSKIGVTVHPSFVASRTAAPGANVYRTPRQTVGKAKNDQPIASSGVQRPGFGAMWIALIAFAISAGALAAVLFHALP